MQTSPCPSSEWDPELVRIVAYVRDPTPPSATAMEAARLILLDSLACALQALDYPACTKLLGPLVPGLVMEHGVPVPGTHYRLDPVQAAFNIGTQIRWLDYNDTWLAAEWGHPSDNLGAVLAVSDWVSRLALQQGKPPLAMSRVLTAIVKAHEIQGVMALKNSFNQVGLDHVALVKLASTAVAADLLGLDRDQHLAAISQVFADGQALRTYRHAPNTGSRKSWAAGDATSRAVRLVLMAQQGEMGYPSILSAPAWGFYDVSFQGRPFRFEREFGSYVAENVLFKISYPAEFHGQSAVEAAITLHNQLKQMGKTSEDIAKVVIRTQAACLRIIDKEGPLNNPADRDHCIQYMVAIALIFGQLTAEDYEDHRAADPRIDALRNRIFCVENEHFTADYHDPEKRSIANAITVMLMDGQTLPEVSVEYPIGHPRRRQEGLLRLHEKFRNAVSKRFSEKRCEEIIHLTQSLDRLTGVSVPAFMQLFAAEGW